MINALTVGFVMEKFFLSSTKSFKPSRYNDYIIFLDLVFPNQIM